jgi:hypothetical protein
MNRSTLLRTAVMSALYSVGLVANAISLELDKLDDLPEFQRAWYAAGADGKFKLDPTKVEIEDVTGLKNALGATRKEVADAKRAADAKLAEFVKQYEGIDPVKTRELLSKFQSDDEASLIAAGKIDEVIARRTAKQQEEISKKLAAAEEREKGALEVASTFMERVLDNEVRNAVTGKVHPSALKNGDILRAAREIFSLNDEGKAVQMDDEGNEILGKDGKTAFTPEEWIESMRESAPHWFPASGSGGGAGGGGSNSASGNYAGLSPTERITAARAAAGKR